MIIKHYRLDKHYGVKRLLKEFLNEGWTKGGLRHLLRKIDKNREFARIPGSGRTPAALANKMLRKLKSLFLVKNKIRELMKVKEILEELLVYHKALSIEYVDNPLV